MAQAQYIKSTDELPKEHALVWIRIEGWRPRKMYRIGRYFWYCNKELYKSGMYSSIGDNVLWRYVEK